MSHTDARLLLLHANDNVLVLRAEIQSGDNVLIFNEEIKLSSKAKMGHKIACREIKAGEKIIKYGVAIGSAIQNIAVGEHVHLCNLKSDYTPTYSLPEATCTDAQTSGETH